MSFNRRHLVSHALSCMTDVCNYGCGREGEGEAALATDSLADDA